MTIDRKYNDSSLSNLWKPFNLKKKKNNAKYTDGLIISCSK